MSKPEKRIGRFQVMALLQAARYYLLTGDYEKALSFGLNRAIFYAWAKRYGRGVKAAGREKITGEVKENIEGNKPVVHVGNEVAFMGPSGYFMIGGKEQTPDDFMREIARRIDPVIPFKEAWRKAIDYVGKFSRETLLDQEKFFKKVYKPVRDSFPHLGGGRKQRTLFDVFASSSGDLSKEN